MENIKEDKKEFIEKFKSLSESRQQEILNFYGYYSIERIVCDVKESAQKVIDFADRKDYGYGEVGYNLNEKVMEFAEDIPELEKEYKHLLNSYFDFLIESKEI